MRYKNGHIYHVYNRANELLFYSEKNYLYFLLNSKRLIASKCTILSWCLMPNHFHFVILANEDSVAYAGEKHIKSLQVLSKNFRTLLSSYTQAINKQQKRKGSLFAHDTKSKCLTNRGNNYLKNLLFYVNLNPVKDGIVNYIQDWKYSSYHEFYSGGLDSISDIDLALDMLNQSRDSFISELNSQSTAGRL